MEKSTNGKSPSFSSTTNVGEQQQQSASLNFEQLVEQFNVQTELIKKTIVLEKRLDQLAQYARSLEEKVNSYEAAKAEPVHEEGAAGPAQEGG